MKTSDDKQSTGVPYTEADTMAAIDAAITEVAATLNQELREANTEPEETELPEVARDAEVLHPSTNNETTGQVYNLHKGKDRKRGRKYSCHFGEHLVAIVHITLTQLSMKSGLCKYNSKGREEVTKKFVQLHIREAFGPLKAEDMTEEKKSTR